MGALPKIVEGFRRDSLRRTWFSLKLRKENDRIPAVKPLSRRCRELPAMRASAFVGILAAGNVRAAAALQARQHGASLHCTVESLVLEATWPGRGIGDASANMVGNCASSCMVPPSVVIPDSYGA